jgi:hypothetical protein
MLLLSVTTKGIEIQTIHFSRRLAICSCPPCQIDL